MATARITSSGTIGRVSVSPSVRTTIADPKFKPKPNVAMTELVDTVITNTQEGEVILYDAITGKFKNAPLGLANIQISEINGGSF